MGIIKDEYRNEYEKRAKEIQSVFINAYFDYYHLRSLEPYLEKFQPKTDEEGALLLPARNFVNSVVRAIQEEFILIVCSLENDVNGANSVHQLKGKLHIFLDNFDLYSKKLFRLKKKDKSNIKDVRNQAIAHIDFDNICDKVSIEKVKNKIDLLKKCFNSCLFDEMIKYKIDDCMIEKIISQSEIGVQQFFSGFANLICNR